MKIRALISLTILSANVCFAQTAPKSDIGTIRQNLNKMQVLGSVLYIAAHPDDENTRLLGYLAQEKHYRTGYLALTRGDGGQNLIGNEQSELLGLIRTQELLAARRVDGAEQFFTRANDFGFSKGPEETLKIWDREKILSDVVWVIRKFRPDVMICRFPTTGEGGHGHHTSSAILAQEAFTAAADPKRFPEQLKYVQVWQAKRLMWNTFNFGSAVTTAENQFKFDVGGYNPLLGKSYGEIAAESRSNHKTQGFGSAAQRGTSYEYFRTILGDAPKTDLMDGVNTTWGRVDGGDAIAAEMADIKKGFDDEHPEKSVQGLVQILEKVKKIKDRYWQDQKTAELSELILSCSGLWVESYAAAPTYALGEKMSVRTQIIKRNDVPAKVYVINYFPASTDDKNYNFTVNTMMPVGENADLPLNSVKSYDQTLLATTAITQPYWLKKSHPIGTYFIDSLDDSGYTDQKTRPENNPYLNRISFKIFEKEITVDRPIKYKYVDPAKGEIYQPVEITPPIIANLASPVYVFNGKQPKVVQVKLKSFVAGSGSIRMQAIPSWNISPLQVPFTNKNKNDEWTAEFVVSPTDNQQKSAELVAVAEINGKTSSLGIQRIHYDHVPNITLFPPAQAKLVSIDLKIKGGSNKIGYIAGAGDLVPEALKQVGYDVHMLTENEIMNTDLSGYDAIITGVRAYNVNPRLVVEQPKLLEYVNKGGNLVVQYNTFNTLVTNQIGPYPFRVVNERVTDETAKVTFTKPNSPVLNFPNKITPADFDGWIQERGLYFVSGIDAKYEAPLEMNDPGEAPKNGSLITTEYGRGRFVYTSLDFFRELPAGVPGAYRLFVNLMSAPPKPVKLKKEK
ncbi:PIG-L family deacetylase [Mucilaginibacter mali]|uniref:PIG-L family deacetylase n=1 Tax=Mucilaginibacter mali TaxID=2740462 RepID=A0A7D4TZQ1_9SPHI|nr:PIG-L family deacetylase [Mucilaginibacter mali]QKJ32417.1 PIG-L family deacetylase [Mucilaginibacter mali]